MVEKINNYKETNQKTRSHWWIMKKARRVMRHQRMVISQLREQNETLSKKAIIVIATIAIIDKYRYMLFYLTINKLTFYYLSS